MSATLTTARAQIDALHRQDPAYAAHQCGEQAEVVDELQYADSMEKWAGELLASRTSDERSTHPLDPELVRLAARCQHLERFKTPRSSFPEGRTGYLRWRSKLYSLQADKAREVLRAANVSQADADSVHKWVRKGELKAGQQEVNDAGTCCSLRLVQTDIPLRLSAARRCCCASFLGEGNRRFCSET